MNQKKNPCDKIHDPNVIYLFKVNNENNRCDMFQVNNRDTRTMPIASF